MVKVKARRTFFTVSVDGDIKNFVYDSQRKPSNCELINYAFSITGGDEIKVVSRETVELPLVMPFEMFYEYSDIE